MITTKELKEIVAYYPSVYSHTKCGSIHHKTNVYKAGTMVRDRLVELGFRKIEDSESLRDGLAEAEQWLNENIGDVGK